MFETAMSWWSSDERIRKLTRLEGEEHLDAALARGRGAILLSAHFTTLEIGARALCARVAANIMYRPTSNVVLERFLMRNRGRQAKRAIPRDDIRTLISALKNNEPVWYAPDQSYRKKGAEMVPFFGIPAATNTATSRLARMTGAAVLPYFPERLPGSHGYRMVIQPMLENFPERRSRSRCATLQRAHRSTGAARARAVPVDPPALQGPDAGLSGLLREKRIRLSDGSRAQQPQPQLLILRSAESLATRCALDLLQRAPQASEHVLFPRAARADATAIEVEHVYIAARRTRAGCCAR